MCVLGVVYLIVTTLVWLFVEISELQVDTLLQLVQCHSCCYEAQWGVNNLICLLKISGQIFNQTKKKKNVTSSLLRDFLSSSVGP